MKGLKRLLMAALILTMAFSMFACSGGDDADPVVEPDGGAVTTGDGSLQRVLDAGVLAIGCEGNWIPYVYNEGGVGDLVGFEVEIAQEIAKRLGVEAKFDVLDQWDGVIAGLDAKRYDTVICGVNPKPDRVESYYMSIAYSENPYALAVAGSNDEIKSFEDLKGKTIGNSISSAAGDIGRRFGAEPLDVSLQEAMELIVLDRCDATINNLTALVDYMEQRPEMDVKIVAVYEPEDRYEIESSAMIRKEDVELGQAVDAAIAEMLADGTCYEIAAKYFGQETADNTSIYQ